MFDDATTAKWAIPQNVNICLTDRHGGFINWVAYQWISVCI